MPAKQICSMEHNDKMAERRAKQHERTPGFERKQPAAREATAWAELNRKHRRAAVAKMQDATRNKHGDVTKRSLSKHTQAVRYAKGVADFGVCPTQPRPIDERGLTWHEQRTSIT